MTFRRRFLNDDDDDRSQMMFYHTVNNNNIARTLYLFFYNLLTRLFIAITLCSPHTHIIIAISSSNIWPRNNNVPSGHRRIYILFFLSLDNNYHRDAFVVIPFFILTIFFHVAVVVPAI